MSQLMNIITGALDGIDLEGSIGGEAGNLVAIANTVSQLTQGQPPDLSSFVATIGELDLPDFDFAGDLTSQVEQVRNLVPTDMLDVLNPITQALESIDDGLGEGITDLIEPFVSAFRAIQTLLHTNFDFSQAESIDGGGEAPKKSTAIIASDPDSQINPAKLQSFQNVLDELPEQATIANLLQWFNDTVSIGRGDVVQAALRSIPYLDDVRAPLNTVLAWQSTSGPDFQSQVNSTLQTLSQAITKQIQAGITGQLQSLSDIVQQLDLTQLRQIVLDITTRLETLKTHIEEDTLTDSLLTTLENEMAPLIAQRDALAQQFLDTVKQQLDSQLKSIEILPEQLHEKMSTLILLLQPPAGFGQANQSSHFPPSVPDATTFSGLDTFLDQYTDTFENLMSALDISEITEAFTVPGQAIEKAVNEIDEAITMVTLEITNRLNQVQSLVTMMDLPGIVDHAEQAIEDFTGSITGDLTAAFSDVRQTIEAIATQISGVVNSFDPAAVVASIEQGIDTLGVELQRPEITSILEVAEKLKSIATRLDQLSFTPITDNVVGTIDDMKSAVQALGNNLDDPLKGMLRGAIDILPDDLSPATDPLIEGLGDLIEAGPIPLLEAIKDAPQEIVDAINGFDPGALVGDSLSEPFQKLISDIEAFEPSDLLDPINTEIENFKNRLRENVKPGDLLNPLIKIHDQILLDLDGFKPSEIIAPINESLTSAVAQITNAIPIEGIFDEIEKVINDIQRILGPDGVADSILQFIQRLREYLTPFVDQTEDISTQIQSWLSDILDNVVDAIDVSALQTTFADLNSALDNTQKDALQALYDNSAAPVIDSVKKTLQPRTLMTEMVRSHSQLRSAWNGMADSINKTRIDSLLLSVNPTAPNFTDIFTAYGQVITVMDRAQQGLSDTLTNWDEVFHSADGVLASYRQIPSSPQELKQWLVDSLDNQLIRPLQSIFEKFAPTGRMLAAFIDPIVALVEALRATANQIIAAPAALLAVGESLEQIRNRLQNVNLDFISESVDTIYNQVKQQIRGLDPRGLKQTLNSSFEELINVISLDRIVPVDALNQTDDDIDQALEALRQLDPQVLITDVIQPKFDEIIAPFVSALDLSPALNSLTERLKPLEAELGSEMERVNQAYQGFLNAVPA